MAQAGKPRRGGSGGQAAQRWARSSTAEQLLGAAIRYVHLCLHGVPRNDPSRGVASSRESKLRRSCLDIRPAHPLATLSGLIYGGVTFGLPDATCSTGMVLMGCRPLPRMRRVTASGILPINSAQLVPCTPPTGYLFSRFFRTPLLPFESPSYLNFQRSVRMASPSSSTSPSSPFSSRKRRGKNAVVEPQLIIQRESGSGP
ncbi:hypothetical protein C4D60_Mb01t05490 [Musa balbisiana]|uniref:Uncharacterized protein n=1 Tax=Musa balbisiana TaxID=52838 RepID=A0A4S8JKC5_MUSBA|nr:hypothetical protein C4D60_Mb01t05490 [Musa balbisiana]